MYRAQHRYGLRRRISVARWLSRSRCEHVILAPDRTCSITRLLSAKSLRHGPSLLSGPFFWTFFWSRSGVPGDPPNPLSKGLASGGNPRIRDFLCEQEVVARPEPSLPCEPRESARTPDSLELELRLPYRYRTTTRQGFISHRPHGSWLLFVGL